MSHGSHRNNRSPASRIMGVTGVIKIIGVTEVIVTMGVTRVIGIMDVTEVIGIMGHGIHMDNGSNWSQEQLVLRES